MIKINKSSAGGRGLHGHSLQMCILTSKSGCFDCEAELHMLAGREGKFPWDVSLFSEHSLPWSRHAFILHQASMQELQMSPAQIEWKLVKWTWCIIDAVASSYTATNGPRL